MILTRKYIMSHRTPRGAWTKSQIEALGIAWPPTKGWINRVSGTEISEQGQILFEAKMGVKQAKRGLPSELFSREIA